MELLAALSSHGASTVLPSKVLLSKVLLKRVILKGHFVQAQFTRIIILFTVTWLVGDYSYLTSTKDNLSFDWATGNKFLNVLFHKWLNVLSLRSVN